MTSPYLDLPKRTEAEVRVSMWDAINRIAAAHAPHPVRDMPNCQWTGMHRFDLDEYLGDGRVIERCMDCKTETRVRGKARA